MTVIIINMLLAMAWALVTGSFTVINLVFGFVISGLLLTLIREQAGSIHHFRRASAVAVLALTFVWELIKSSVSVAVIVLSPWRKLRPAIIAFPLDVRRDSEITLLANLITLTPGTLSMDVSPDRKTLFIHAIDATDTDEIIADIKSSFERKIERIFQQ
ncbi:MAG: Na+/H+ antiporter subunit E [Pseudomonadota bacterium]